jgi:futalosine hydrolase
MEGFGVLRAAEHAGVPAVEVRAIANDIEERDRALWHLDAAFAAVAAATPLLVREIAACVS